MNEIVERVWRLQREWSQRANELKSAYSRWQLASLVLAISGAILGTLGTQLGGSAAGGLGPLLGAAGAAALALLAVIGQWGTTPERLRGWIRARSVSEELKALVYIHLAGCSREPAEGTREQRLWSRAMDLAEAASDLAGTPVTADDKPRPAVHDVDSYVAVRIDSEQPKGQLQYYRQAAAKAHRIVRTGRGLRFGLACLGAIVGAVGALGEISALTAWIAVLTTAVAAFAAHVAAGRHEFLEISYLATATRLRRLLGDRIVDPQGDPCAFVHLCETAISSQNEGWMAEFMKKSDAPQSP